MMKFANLDWIWILLTSLIQLQVHVPTPLTSQLDHQEITTRFVAPSVVNTVRKSFNKFFERYLQSNAAVYFWYLMNSENVITMHQIIHFQCIWKLRGKQPLKNLLLQ